MYADDTQTFSSSYDANEPVVKLNSDLARVSNWLIENKLQMHPFKVIPLKLFDYQTFFVTWRNEHSWYEHYKMK